MNIKGTLTSPQTRLMIGIPTTGSIRMEWALARWGQVIPCNWSQTDTLAWMVQQSPLNWAVADARNFCVEMALRNGFEWLLFIDHDVILPPTAFIQLNEYMIKADTPVVSGLYFTKSVPAEPLIYRGRGTSYFADWKIGDKVWVDGVPMGCTLIHTSILKAMYAESPEYNYRGTTVRKVFETPARVYVDPETGGVHAQTGTEDLTWCTRIQQEGFFVKSGWPEFQKKEYPFLMDTGIFCRHIDENGRQYPMHNEESRFLPDNAKKAWEKHINRSE